MKRIAAVALVGILTVGLTSCSVPAEWAARLNADGSVDYLSCYGPLDSIEVDFIYSAESDPAPVEWAAEISSGSLSDVRSSSIDVAYYGEVPAEWNETVPAVEPPERWEYVSTSAGFAERVDLVEGSWVWFTNDDHWAWIPPQPCEGWEFGPDGEPRRTA